MCLFVFPNWLPNGSPREEDALRGEWLLWAHICFSCHIALNLKSAWIWEIYSRFSSDTQLNYPIVYRLLLSEMRNTHNLRLKIIRNSMRNWQKGFGFFSRLIFGNVLWAEMIPLCHSLSTACLRRWHRCQGQGHECFVNPKDIYIIHISAGISRNVVTSLLCASLLRTVGGIRNN